VQRHQAPEIRQRSKGFASNAKTRTIELCKLCEAPDVTEASITYLTVRDIQDSEVAKGSEARGATVRQPRD
jgi:RNA polymerase subunit RPABC4/transcription elongation factor Spt4